MSAEINDRYAEIYYATNADSIRKRVDDLIRERDRKIDRAMKNKPESFKPSVDRVFIPVYQERIAAVYAEYDAARAARTAQLDALAPQIELVPVKGAMRKITTRKSILELTPFKTRLIKRGFNAKIISTGGDVDTGEYALFANCPPWMADAALRRPAYPADEIAAMKETDPNIDAVAIYPNVSKWE